MDKQIFDRFVYYLAEREKIKDLKELGYNSPWTDDPILQEWKFCCVDREDDKTTKWFKNNLRHDPRYKMSDTLFAAVAYRWFNRIETGETLLHNDLIVNWDAQKAEDKIRSQEKFLGSAYRIAAPAGDKVKSLVGLCDEFHKMKDDYSYEMEQSQTLTGIQDIMQSVKYLGPFTAYQVVVDLTFTKFGDNKFDFDTFCVAGPGAIRGLNRLHNRPVDQVTSRIDYVKEINDLKENLKGLTPFKFTARDVQHNLCELDKYSRVVDGGRMKTRYK